MEKKKNGFYFLGFYFDKGKIPWQKIYRTGQKHKMNKARVNK